jgi:hypothetical protein
LPKNWKVVRGWQAKSKVLPLKLVEIPSHWRRLSPINVYNVLHTGKENVGEYTRKLVKVIIILFRTNSFLLNSS